MTAHNKQSKTEQTRCCQLLVRLTSGMEIDIISILLGLVGLRACAEVGGQAGGRGLRRTPATCIKKKSITSHRLGSDRL